MFTFLFQHVSRKHAWRAVSLALVSTAVLYLAFLVVAEPLHAFAAIIASIDPKSLMTI